MIKRAALLLLLNARMSFASDDAKKQGVDIDKGSSSQWESKTEADVKDQSDQIRKLRMQLLIKTHENLGLEALLQGDPMKAREQYDDVLKLDPDNVEAFLYRASARTETKDAQGALADFSAAIEKQRHWLITHKSPADQEKGKKALARIYGSRGAAYMSMGLNSRNDAALLNMALTDFDQALAIGHPKPAILTWEKSQVMAVLQRWQEASALYQQALTEDPGRKNNPSHKTFCSQFADHGFKVGVCS